MKAASMVFKTDNVNTAMSYVQHSIILLLATDPDFTIPASMFLGPSFDSTLLNFKSSLLKELESVLQDLPTHQSDVTTLLDTMSEGVHQEPELEALVSAGHIHLQITDGVLYLGLSPNIRPAAWKVYTRNQNNLDSIETALVRLVIFSLPIPYNEVLWEATCSSYRNILSSTVMPFLYSAPERHLRYLQIPSTVRYFLAFHLTHLGFSLERISWKILSRGSLHPDEELFLDMQKQLGSVLNAKGPQAEILNFFHIHPCHRLQDPILRSLVGFTICQLPWRNIAPKFQHCYGILQSWWNDTCSSTQQPRTQRLPIPEAIAETHTVTQEKVTERLPIMLLLSERLRQDLTGMELVAHALLDTESIDVDYLLSHLPLPWHGALGVGLSRQRQFRVSWQFLKSSLGALPKSSVVHGVVSAELIKNYNLLERAKEAQAYGRDFMENYLVPAYRSDYIYVKIATADACVALGDYEEARQYLEEVLSISILRPYIKVSTALRLNKVLRRVNKKEDRVNFGKTLGDIILLTLQESSDVQAEFLTELQATIYHTRQEEMQISPSLHKVVSETLLLYAQSNATLSERIKKLRELHNASRAMLLVQASQLGPTGSLQESFLNSVEVSSSEMSPGMFFVQQTIAQLTPSCHNQ